MRSLLQTKDGALYFTCPITAGEKMDSERLLLRSFSSVRYSTTLGDECNCQS